MRNHIGLYSYFGIKDVLIDISTMLSIFAGDASRRALYNVSSLRFGRRRRILGGKLHTRGSDISISRGAARPHRGWRMPRVYRSRSPEAPWAGSLFKCKSDTGNADVRFIPMTLNLSPLDFRFFTFQND